MSGALDPRARFRAERTPWERPIPNAAFVTWRREGVLLPCRILVPGAGRSGEPLALAQDGFDVTVLDEAAAAVAVQRVRLHAAGLSATLHEAPLLAWVAHEPFDAIYDLALCGLPHADRPAYVDKLAAWLRPGGSLFLLALPTSRPGAAPYPLQPDSLRALFAEGWRLPDAAIGPAALGEAAIVLRRADPPVA